MDEARADARNQMMGRQAAAVERLEDRARNMPDENGMNRQRDLDTYMANNPMGVTGTMPDNNPPLFGGRRRTNRRRTNRRRNKRSNRRKSRR